MSKVLMNALNYSQESSTPLSGGDSSLGLASASNAIAENYNELQRLSLESQALSEAEVTLESYLDLMATTMEDGGDVSEIEDSFRLTMESMFGKEYADTIEFSQEGIGRVLKKIGQGSKNLVGRIQRRWKDFVASLGDGWGKLEKRIKEVEGDIKKVSSGAEPAKDAIKIAGVSRLHIDGNVDATFLARNYANYMANVRQFASDTVSFGSEFIEQVEETQKQIAELDKKTEKTEIEKLRKKSVSATSKLIDTYISNVKRIDDEPLPGGQVISVRFNPQFYIKKPSRDQNLDELMMWNMNKMGEYKEKDTVPTPSPEEMKTLMVEAMKSIEAMTPLLENMNQFVRDASELKKSGDNAPRIMEKINPSSGIAGIASQLISNYFGNNVDAWVSFIGFNAVEAYDYTFQTTRALVEYCERGVSQYK